MSILYFHFCLDLCIPLLFSFCEGMYQLRLLVNCCSVQTSFSRYIVKCFQPTSSPLLAFSPALTTQYRSTTSQSAKKLTPSRILELTQEGADAFKEGDYAGAIELWEEIVSSGNPADAAATRSFISCCGNLAWAYRYTGNTQKELEVLERTKTLVQGCYGDNHPQYTQLVCRMAEGKEDLGFFLEMKEMLTDLLAELKKNRSSNKGDVKVSRVLLLLSRAHGQLSEAAEQLRTAEQGMDLIRQHFSAEHLHTTTAMITLARAIGANGDIQKHLDLVLNAYEIQESQLGRLHGQLATSAMEVATAFRLACNFEKEKDFLEKSIEIQKRSVEPTIPTKLISTQVQLGDVHLKLYRDKPKAALSHYLESIRTARRLLLAPHPVLSLALFRLACCYKLIGGGEEAKCPDLLLQSKNILTIIGVSTMHPVYKDVMGKMDDEKEGLSKSEK